MPESISNDVLTIMYYEMIGLFVIPIIAIILWKIVKKGKLLPFFIGLIGYFLFAQLLESLPQSWLLGGGNGIFEYILARPWLYALCSGLIAAVFEELGRFFCLGLALKSYDDRRDGITFAIGAGLAEVFFGTVITLFMYVSFSAVLNESGSALNFLANIDASEQEDLISMMTYIGTISVTDCIISFVDAITSIALQIGLSVIMFTAAHDEKKRWLFHLCILMHLIACLPLMLNAGDVISSSIISACAYVIFTALICFYAYREYKTQKQAVTPKAVIGRRLR